MRPNGIWLKMFGRVTKTSPGPSPGLMPKEKTHGKMTAPDRKATRKSMDATCMAVDEMFSVFLRYEPYVVMVPMPMLSEKND